jgi:hypothetical protein
MPVRTLSQDALHRALLARQHLLERGSGRLVTAIERIGGLQTQYAPSGYIGLWSRLEGFERDRLTAALEKRTVVQGTLMRSTIHMVSAGDYRPFVAGIREARRESWLRGHRGQHEPAAMAAAAKRARTLLADGPRRRDEAMRELGVNNVIWNGIGLWVDLVRAPPSGTWEQRRADLYALADGWVGGDEPGHADGVDLLVRRYLGAFGPAAARDIADWAGLPPKTVAASAGRLELRRFRDEGGADLLDVPRGALPDPGTAAPVRFLPTWDATLLVHARRTQILPERFRPRVFNTKTPHSVPTFLVDGRVAGIWRNERGRVVTEPFEALAAGPRREVAAEAKRLAGFMS